MTHVESREAVAEAEDDAVKRTEEFDDWLDLAAEIWGSVCDGARDNGAVCSEDTAEQEELRDATRLEAACRNLPSITVRGSMTKTTKTTETMHCLANEHAMHVHVVSVRSGPRRAEDKQARGKTVQRSRSEILSHRRHGL